jgi:hypothetical protein
MAAVVGEGRQERRRFRQKMFCHRQSALDIHSQPNRQPGSRWYLSVYDVREPLVLLPPTAL